MSIEEYDDNEEELEPNEPQSLTSKAFRFIGNVVVGGVVMSGALAVSVAGPMTSGANVRNFLGTDGKPILMELKNCRIVEQRAPAAPGAIFR